MKMTKHTPIGAATHHAWNDIAHNIDAALEHNRSMNNQKEIQDDISIANTRLQRKQEGANAHGSGEGPGRLESDD